LPHAPPVADGPRREFALVDRPHLPWRPAIRLPLLALLVVLGGTLYALHVVHTGAAALAYVSTVPWVLVAVHPRLRGRGNALAFLVMVGLAWYLGLSWLAHFSTMAWAVAPLLYF